MGKKTSFGLGALVGATLVIGAKWADKKWKITEKFKEQWDEAVQRVKGKNSNEDPEEEKNEDKK